jgi:hypothetical protein
MNTKTRVSLGILAIICLSAARASAVFAAELDNPTAIPLQHPDTVNPQTLIPTLEKAYTTLASADHDYNGHRGAAMKDIATAAQLLGTDITGQGKGGEPQKLSDLQIRSVQMDLLGVGRNLPDGPDKKEIVRHINGAIRQLSVALDEESPHPSPGAVQPGAEPGIVNQPGAVNVTPGLGSANSSAVEDPIGSNSLEISSLERIYEILQGANHDYQGHRAKAMHAIANAVRILGGDVSGGGKGGENQATSDEQLRQSETLLEQVRNSFTSNDPKKVSAALNRAVDDLTAALAVK